MDAEHRHELKTNELADWMGHFPDFCRKNARTIIGVSLILAAAVVFFYSRGVRSKSRFDQEAQAIALIERLDYNKIMTIQAQREGTAQGTAAAGSIGLSAQSLEMAAGEAKSPHVAALLLIKQGDALRIDLHYRAEEVDPDVIGNQIKNAREAYEKALIQAQGNNTLVALANFGLGMCAEEIGDYTKAATIYDSIIADADFAGTVLPQQAQDRLDNIENNKMQFVFVTAELPKLEILKPEDIKIELTPPERVVPDAPKPDANQPGTVEIKAAGEDTLPPTVPVTEEPGPPTAPVGEEPGPPTAPVGEEPGPPTAPVGEEPGPPTAPVGEDPGPPTAPAGEEPGPPTVPADEEPGPVVPETSKPETDSSPDKEPETN